MEKLKKNSGPFFIVLDGGEGAGKGTQMRFLKGLLGEEDTVFTLEPGGTPLGQEIRNTLLKSKNGVGASAKTQFALFWADRADHMDRVVLPALRAGKNVISDRGDSSTFAYQIFGKLNHSLADLFWSVRDFYLREAFPDHYIFLDIDPVLGLTRKVAQPEEVNHFELQTIDFHQRVRSGFKVFLERVPHTVIDASRPVAEVSQQLRLSLIELGLRTR